VTQELVLDTRCWIRNRGRSRRPVMAVCLRAACDSPCNALIKEES
jgi:hypothetical protein